jgi:hypothetical protein
MSKLSMQVHELEQKAERLEHENENLKFMLYRMIASNKSGIKLVPYSDTKARMIKKCEFYIRDNVSHIGITYLNRYNIDPNNTQDEL